MNFFRAFLTRLSMRQVIRRILECQNLRLWQVTVVG